MHQFKVQQINCCASDQEMLKNSECYFPNHFPNVFDTTEFVWVGIKNDNDPGYIQDQQKPEPGTVPGENDKVSL